MKNYIYILLLLTFILFPIIEKNRTQKLLRDNCIEIYLYKEYVMPENCIWFKDSKQYDTIYRAYKKSIVDTLKNVYLQGKEFNLNSKNLKEILFKNNEIIGLNKNGYTIILNFNKYQNTFNWGNNLDLEQFIITLNKKPILSGYFYNGIKSYQLKDEILLFLSFGTDLKYKTKSGYFKTYRKQNQCELIYTNLKNYKAPCNFQRDYPELYQAFKNSGRLIE